MFPSMTSGWKGARIIGMAFAPALSDPATEQALRTRDRFGLMWFLGGAVALTMTMVVITVTSPDGASSTAGREDPRWLVILTVGGLIVSVTAIAVGLGGLVRTARYRRLLAVCPWRRTRATYVVVKWTSQAGDYRRGIVAKDLDVGDPTAISLRGNWLFALARSGLGDAEWADVAGEPGTGFVVRGPEKAVLLSGRVVRRYGAGVFIEAASVPPGTWFRQRRYYRRR